MLTQLHRIRKVKCDEARPSCERCVKAGRICDGYRDQQPATARGMTLAIRSARRASRTPTPDSVHVSLPSWMATADPRETLAFDFYIRRVAPVLAGEFDSHFWAGLVPRLCQAEPAVRHAVFSLGAVFRAVEGRSGVPPEPGDPATNFSIAEYNKAISSLLSLDAGRTSGQEPTAIYLLACIVFVCIEFMLGNEFSSHAHIHQGRQLLQRLDEGAASRNSPQMELIRRNLVPIYSRLAITSFTWGQVPVAIPPSLNLHARVPAEFTSTEEARGNLYSVLDDGLRTSKEVRTVKYAGMVGDHGLQSMQEAERVHQEVLSRLKSWNLAFTLYLANRSAMGGRSGPTPGERVMSMYYHVAYIWISTSFSMLETSYDDYMEHFTSIVSQASSIQRSSGGNASQAGTASSYSEGTSIPSSPGSNSSRSSGNPPAGPSSRAGTRTPEPPSPMPFVFHDNVIPPLYYTAIRCRHPRLRRAALNLLKDLSHVSPREALWDARYLVPVATRIMELEGSGGTVQDGHEPPFGVPDEARVREVLIGELNEDRKDLRGTGIMIFRKPNGAEGEWQTHREWIPVTI